MTVLLPLSGRDRRGNIALHAGTPIVLRSDGGES